MIRKRAQNTNPLRRVVSAELREGSSIISDQFYMRWYDCHLECGHVEERRVRFPKQEGRSTRGFAIMHHPRPLGEELPAPKRVRCATCGREIRERTD